MICPILISSMVVVSILPNFEASYVQKQEEIVPIYIPPIIYPATGNHTATIILLHGIKDTGHKWYSLVRDIRQPYMKIICPTAEVRPISMYDDSKRRAWFDDRKDLDDEDTEGIKKASEFVREMIEAEIKNGTPPERILLGGFYQGGALALYTALKFPKKLAGIVALNTWLPMHKSFNEYFNPTQKNIPIFQSHGEQDPNVSLDKSLWKTSAILKKISNKVEFLTYAHCRHAISLETMSDIKKFVLAHLGPV